MVSLPSLPLYLKNGKLKYVYNFKVKTSRSSASNVNLPLASACWASFVKEKMQAIRNSPCTSKYIGTATPYTNNQKVGELKV